MKYVLPVLILASALGGAWFLVKTKPASVVIEVEEKAWNVRVEQVRLQALRPRLRLYGHVESSRAARVAAAVAADVLETPVREGDRVVQGQLLARLDGAEAALEAERRAAELAQMEADILTEKQRHASNQAALSHERALLDLKRKAVQRAKDLANKRVGSQNTLDEALQGVEAQRLQLEQRQLAIRGHAANRARLEAGRRRAQALLERARLDSARTEVTAPFDGVISRVRVAPGDRVAPGTVLVELFDARALEVRAQAPSQALARLRGALTAGDALTARARVDGVELTLRLRGLSGRVNEASGSVEALFDIVRGGEGAPLGRFVALDLDMPLLQGLAVLPPEAVYGRDRIYLLEDGRMRAARIERMGETRLDDGRSRILARSEALQDGVTVIVTQLPNAIDGLRVHAVED